VEYKDGVYYYMNTTGTDLTLWRTRNIADLGTAEKKVLWQPPAAGPYSHDLWAPEIHFLSGKWYIYFAADGGNNQSHRIWVIENSSADPFQGEWTLKGKVAEVRRPRPALYHLVGLGGRHQQHAEYLHRPLEESVDGGGAAYPTLHAGVSVGKSRRRRSEEAAG
jgi:GH43 family beta-xylosidase